MDFLDNAIVKAKEAFGVVSKKTEEIVTTEKQKFDVNSLKAKLQKDYAKLGKYYFETVLANGEADENVKDTVEAIKEKLNEIEKLNAEILAAKAKRLCPACSAAVPENAKFCNNCGEKLIIDSEEQ